MALLVDQAVLIPRASVKTLAQNRLGFSSMVFSQVLSRCSLMKVTQDAARVTSHRATMLSNAFSSKALTRIGAIRPSKITSSLIFHTY